MRYRDGRAFTTCLLMNDKCIECVSVDCFCLRLLKLKDYEKIFDCRCDKFAFG